MIHDHAYERSFNDYQKEIKSLQAKLSACATGPWEPIADAPRDGTYVLMEHVNEPGLHGYLGRYAWFSESNTWKQRDESLVSWVDAEFTHFARINKGE
jgi:hypothetical protein